jgi:hypothetical protein
MKETDLFMHRKSISSRTICIFLPFIAIITLMFRYELSCLGMDFM